MLRHNALPYNRTDESMARAVAFLRAFTERRWL